MASKTKDPTRREPGTGSYTILESGSVRIRYCVAGKTFTKTFKQEGKGAGDQRTARALVTAKKCMRSALAAANQGKHHDPRSGNIRLTQCAATWIAERIVPATGEPLGPRVKVLYTGFLENHIGPDLGHLELGMITKSRVRAWHASKPRGDHDGGPTTAKCYRFLRTVLATAVEDDLIPVNPCQIRGAGKEPHRPRDPISLPDVDIITAHMDPRWRAVVLVGAWCGLRFGELAALERHHVDLLHNVIRVEQSAGQVLGQGRTVGPPKTRAGHREVDIPPHLVADIRDHLTKYVSPEATAPVFTGPEGGFLNSGNFHKKVWGPALEAAGVTAHFHDTRITAGTLWGAIGAPQAAIMDRLGHDSPDASRRYQRATAHQQVALAALLSQTVTDGDVGSRPPLRLVAHR